jgi:hypothetical protein
MPPASASLSSSPLRGSTPPTPIHRQTRQATRINQTPTVPHRRQPYPAYLSPRHSQPPSVAHPNPSPNQTDHPHQPAPDRGTSPTTLPSLSQPPSVASAGLSTAHPNLHY